MTILKNLLIGLVALIVLLAIVGLFLPSTVHLERSTVIAAPQSTVFTLLNSYKRFNEWSPWAGIDPETSYTYEGPDHGVGAKMSWQSENRDVGSGSQEITASRPWERVEAELDFGPQGTAQAFFDVASEDTGTRVTWGFDTDFGYNPIQRYFGLLIEKFLGPQYEQGLASLKELAESLPQADFSDLEAEVTEVEPVTIAFVNGTTTQHPLGVQWKSKFQKRTVVSELTAVKNESKINKHKV